MVFNLLVLVLAEYLLVIGLALGCELLNLLLISFRVSPLALGLTVVFGLYVFFLLVEFPLSGTSPEAARILPLHIQIWGQWFIPVL